MVLKSDKAYGRLSLKSARNQIFVRELVYGKGRQFGVAVGDFVNMGNHLHIKVKAGSRAQFQKFLRSISGRIARFVTGASRGRPFGRFWEGLAFTRILTSRIEELRLHHYFCANRTEAVAGRGKREEYLREMNSWFQRLRKEGAGRGRARPFDSTAPPAWA